MVVLFCFFCRVNVYNCGFFFWLINDLVFSNDKCILYIFGVCVRKVLNWVVCFVLFKFIFLFFCVKGVKVFEFGCFNFSE